MEISKQEFEAITKLVPEKRYDYFIKRICDWKQVWTLYNDDCIIINEDKREICLYFYSLLNLLHLTMQ